MDFGVLLVLILVFVLIVVGVCVGVVEVVVVVVVAVVVVVVVLMVVLVYIARRSSADIHTASAPEPIHRPVVITGGVGLVVVVTGVGLGVMVVGILLGVVVVVLVGVVVVVAVSYIARRSSTVIQTVSTPEPIHLPDVITLFELDIVDVIFVRSCGILSAIIVFHLSRSLAALTMSGKDM